MKCLTNIIYELLQYFLLLTKGKEGNQAAFFPDNHKLELVWTVIPAILLTEERKIFAQPKLYIAFVLGLLLIAPNLLWQYNNGFPVVHHMKELAETQLVNVDRLEFLKSQLFVFIGSFFVILSGWLALLLYKPFHRYRLFFWSIIFTLAVFMYFKAKDYYAIGLYPIYISFGSVYLGNQLKEGWKIQYLIDTRYK